MENAADLKFQIKDYWGKRSSSFAKLRIEELKSNKYERFMAIIKEHLPTEKNLKVLDVGTGCGFFSIILSRLGHSPTGIDLSDDMILEAKSIAAHLGYKDIDYIVMDAESLDFEDNTFDVVISRNLTWTLPNAEKAYAQWYRVLKSEGLLLNFDAEYAKEEFKFVKGIDISLNPHGDIDEALLKQGEGIRVMLNSSRIKRPEWDIEVLKSIGFSQVAADLSIHKRIYKEKDMFYNSSPMFLIQCIK